MTAFLPAIDDDCACQHLRDAPGFTRAVPLEEIRAKEENLSVPLYIDEETIAKTYAAAETATTALPDALSYWHESAQDVQAVLEDLVEVNS